LIAERKSEIQAAAVALRSLLTRPNSVGVLQSRSQMAGGGLVPGPHGMGAGALGNRSIVCDPRRADMKAILNSKIKRRESFRPFHLQSWKRP